MGNGELPLSSYTGLTYFLTGPIFLLLTDKRCCAVGNFDIHGLGIIIFFHTHARFILAYSQGTVLFNRCYIKIVKPLS